MGAEAAVEWHDGLPPGEDEIAARMRAEGLSPHGWGNGPADMRDYAPWLVWPQCHT